MTCQRVVAEGCGLWTHAEHVRFLEAVAKYPKGPWKLVAQYVGTRNVRQTMTHAQKHRQKKERHQRGLRTRRKSAFDDHASGSSSSSSTTAQMQPSTHSAACVSTAPPPQSMAMARSQDHSFVSLLAVSEAPSNQRPLLPAPTQEASMQPHLLYKSMLPFVPVVSSNAAWGVDSPQDFSPPPLPPAPGLLFTDIPDVSDCLDYFLQTYGD